MSHSLLSERSLIALFTLCLAACSPGANGGATGDGAPVAPGAAGDGTSGNDEEPAGNGEPHQHPDGGTDPEDGAGGAPDGAPAATGGSHHTAGSGGSGTGGDHSSDTGGAGGTDSMHGAGEHEMGAAGTGDDGSGGSHEHEAGGTSSTGGSGALGGMGAAGSGGTGASGGTAGSGGSGGVDAAGSGGTTDHEHETGGSGGMGATGGGGSAGTDTGGGAGTDTGGSAGTDTGGSGGTDTGGSGGSGGSTHEHDHCVDGELPDARDTLLATPSAPGQFVASNGDIDLTVPDAVLAWMDERAWKPTHDAWHNIRRCRGASGSGSGSPTSSAVMCTYTELVPEHQECADAINGYEFLVMHRHMMLALRQAFPGHADLFDGFPHFPFAATDVPLEWQARFGSGWSKDIVNVANKLEDIENHLSEFPTEGDLGKYIQCGLASSGATSIHGAMHFKWVVNESPNSLGKQTANLGNFMFWKLHGWIDGIWERYRVAKGLAPDEPKLREAMTAQCREMHALGRVIDPELGGGDPEPVPEESGYFHEQVRPALERLCTGCHSESSPPAHLSLGGALSSAAVVANLVNVPSVDGGQFFRVVPGDPDQSWLYLKASAQAAEAGCVGSSCNVQSMPPGAPEEGRLTADELGRLRQWILDGAPGPE